MTACANTLFRWKGCIFAPLALAIAAVGVPYFSTHGFLPIALALQRGFAVVCHQHPERSVWIFGAPVAVCARCLGIYLGAAIGLLFRTSRRLALRLLTIAAALNLLDVATEFAGLHGNWLGMRFVLGIALGASAGILISAAIADSRAPYSEIIPIVLSHVSTN